MSNDMVQELRGWAAETWSDEMLLRHWWEALAEAGWAFPSWPSGLGGRGADPEMDGIVRLTLRRDGLLPPPDGLGQMMGGPVVAQHGTSQQQHRYLPSLAAGLETWCQLFSEPDAGSDLAAVRTSATRDGETWIAHGQKTWTSGAHIADRGMLIARTNLDAPKHKGMTYFILDMDQDGVEPRPLRDMTGEAFFNDVFIEDARISDRDRIGGAGEGWSVALSTLAFERSGLAARGGVGPQANLVRPGARTGLLDRKVGEVLALAHAEQAKKGKSAATAWRDPQRLIQLAQDLGRSNDPVMRQRLAAYHARFQAMSLTRRRAGEMTDARLALLNKLGSASLVRPARDLAVELLGAAALVRDGETTAAEINQMFLASPATTIAGGTDEVQRNIIGERALGLPKEPRVDRDIAFREVSN